MFWDFLFGWLTRGRRLKRIRDQAARLRREIEQMENVSVPFRRMGETHEGWQLRQVRASLNQDELDAKRDAFEELVEREALMTAKSRFASMQPMLRSRRPAPVEPAPAALPPPDPETPAVREVPWNPESKADEIADQPAEVPPTQQPEPAAPPSLPSTDVPVAGIVTMEWLGASCYRFISPRGKVVLTNPWGVDGHMVDLGTPPRADIMLVAGGGAEQADYVALAALDTNAFVVRPLFDGVAWPTDDFDGERFNQSLTPGDRLPIDGITIYVVSGEDFGKAGRDTTARDASAPDGSAQAGSTPEATEKSTTAGFIIVFENGWVVYFAVETADPERQALIAEMYRPDVAILPIRPGEGTDFANQVRVLMANNPHISSVFTHQVDEAPAEPDRTVEEAQAAIDAMNLDMAVTPPTIGTSYSLPDQYLSPRRPAPAVQPALPPAEAPTKLPDRAETPIAPTGLQPVEQVTAPPPIEHAIEAPPPIETTPVAVVLPEILDKHFEGAPSEPVTLAELDALTAAVPESDLADETAALDPEPIEETEPALPELAVDADATSPPEPALVQLRRLRLPEERHTFLSVMTLEASSVPVDAFGGWIMVRDGEERSAVVSHLELEGPDRAVHTTVPSLDLGGPTAAFRATEVDRSVWQPYEIPLERPEAYASPMERPPEAPSAIEEIDLDNLRGGPAPRPEPVSAPRISVVTQPPGIKPPKVDIAACLPFVQKRRQREYDKLMHEVARLDADVIRLGQMYDDWLRQQEDPESGISVLGTRRLREAMTSEELLQKRSKLGALQIKVAEMEARYPALVRPIASDAEKPA